MVKRTIFRSQAGFSLIELLVVIVIIGILAAIAYPAYTQHVVKSNRALAMADLSSMAQEMERVYARAFDYSGVSLASNPSAVNQLPNYSPSEGSYANRVYDITFQAIDSSLFTLRATPRSGSIQEGEGYLELNQAGAKLWDRNNDGDTGDADENNWGR